jgi:hypothetical protein
MTAALDNTNAPQAETTDDLGAADGVTTLAGVPEAVTESSYRDVY